MMRHPKFKDERVCPTCTCNFLPHEKGQIHCLGCNPNPQPVIPEPEHATKTKTCVKCGGDFSYTHPAAKYCNVCKK